MRTFQFYYAAGVSRYCPGRYFFEAISARACLCVAAVLSAYVISISLPGGTVRAQTAFYQATEGDIVGRAGTLIRQEPMPFVGGTAYRVLYRSTGLHDEPIAVSGVVIVPPGPPPPGGRPIVAWAHPTTGIVPHCAPSLAIFIFQQIQGLRDMVERGYAVAATDYPGLGTPGPHPYLVGVSEARAVLDSVRVARTMPGVGGSDRFAVWGHSQGGHAALFTGLIAQSYAPELKLVGVAAAAPASELATLINDDLSTAGGKNIAAMTLWSWARVYGAPIQDVVVPAGMPTIDLLAQECIESAFDLETRRITERPLEQNFLSVSRPSDVEPWRSLLARNTPATLPPGVPVFLAQGTTDAIIRPQVTQDYMQRLCKAGSRVRLLMMPGIGHGLVAERSARTAVAWMADRFTEAPAPSDCGP
jgi:alpha-beta hydrolase superfamily lysophospholipase